MWPPVFKKNVFSPLTLEKTWLKRRTEEIQLFNKIKRRYLK